jgi:uncharacterized protein with GYD domain
MPTYLCLCNWTQKGIENIKESPKRLDDAKTFFREMGVEMKSFYMTSGRYDMVIVVEAKDENALARTMLAQGAKGGIRTETLRAFTEDEYRRVISSIP